MAEKFNYMMLSRLESDCKYYLANRCVKHLWAGDVKKQIDEITTVLQTIKNLNG